MIRTYLDWILTLPWSETTEDNLDLEPRARDPRRGPLRPREGEGADPRVPRGLEAEERPHRPDPLLRRPARASARPRSASRSPARVGRKFVRLSVGGVRDEAEIRGHRRTYIGAMPGTIIRSLRDAGVEEPGAADRRDRQDGRRLPRRPGERDARGARPRAELALPRPLPRPAVRPLEGAVHLHREPARDDPGPAARPDGRDPALRLHRGREARDRPQVPRAEAARGARPQPASRSTISDDTLRVVIREYTREAGVRNLERRIADLCARSPARSPRARPAKIEIDTRKAREVARPAPLPGRPAQAHRRPGRRDRPRLHARRRRRPLHRGDRVPRQGQADDHRPARRRDEGVRAGRALVGALAHRASSGSRRTGSPSTTSTSTSRPARSRRTGPRPASRSRPRSPRSCAASRSPRTSA